MLNETEAAASFHGLCHFFGRLSKASRAGMKAALRGCPKSVSYTHLTLPTILLV